MVAAPLSRRSTQRRTARAVVLPRRVPHQTSSHVVAHEAQCGRSVPASASETRDQAVRGWQPTARQSHQPRASSENLLDDMNRALSAKLRAADGKEMIEEGVLRRGGLKT